MINLLVAAIAGVLNALSFAPFAWWPLSLLSFAMLFMVWLYCNTRTAALCGFAFGLGMYGVGVSWMYISLHTFGGMPPFFAGLSILLGIAFISLYGVVCGILQGWFREYRETARLAFIMPAIWIIFEWLRGWLFTGFTWLSTGYAYIDTPLSNLAPIGGVYLVGLITLMSAGTLVSLIRNMSWWNASIAIALSGIWVVGWQLNETKWTNAQGDPVAVLIVQNNVPLMEKWNRAESNRIVENYISRSMEHKDVDLIVWPEAAIPYYIDQLGQDFWRDIETHPADFIFGVLHRETVGGSQQSFNSVAAVTDRIMIYRKRHLVPFGEYLPLQPIFGPLVEMMDIPMGNFTAYRNAQLPLQAADNQFAVSVCFEDAFPYDTREQIPHAGVLLNVSEDIWFGDSFAPHQRLQMARFRARESERPMIRSSNNGLSSLINWKGGIEQFSPQFVQDLIKGTVQPRTGTTPYIAFADSPVLSAAGFLLLTSIIFGRRRRNFGNQ